jgi:hypothetical protein
MPYLYKNGCGPNLVRTFQTFKKEINCFQFVLFIRKAVDVKHRKA